MAFSCLYTSGSEKEGHVPAGSREPVRQVAAQLQAHYGGIDTRLRDRAPLRSADRAQRKKSAARAIGSRQTARSSPSSSSMRGRVQTCVRSQSASATIHIGSWLMQSPLWRASRKFHFTAETAPNRSIWMPSLAALRRTMLRLMHGSADASAAVRNESVFIGAACPHRCVSV